MLCRPWQEPWPAEDAERELVEIDDEDEQPGKDFGWALCNHYMGPIILGIPWLTFDRFVLIFYSYHDRP